MVVNKIWICENTTQLKGNESADELKTNISEGVLSILLQMNCVVISLLL